MYLFTDSELEMMPYGELEAIELAAWSLYSTAANDRDYLKWAFGSATACEESHEDYRRIRRIALDRSIAMKAAARGIERLTELIAIASYTEASSKAMQALTDIVYRNW